MCCQAFSENNSHKSSFNYFEFPRGFLKKFKIALNSCIFIEISHFGPTRFAPTESCAMPRIFY